MLRVAKEIFWLCSRPGAWDPPQSHQLEQEVLCHELKQPLQVPPPLHAWAALSCVRNTNSHPDEPLGVLNLSVWPLVRGRSLFLRQWPAVAVPPSPIQRSWLVHLLGAVAGAFMGSII